MSNSNNLVNGLLSSAYQHLFSGVCAKIVTPDAAKACEKMKILVQEGPKTLQVYTYIFI